MWPLQKPSLSVSFVQYLPPMPDVEHGHREALSAVLCQKHITYFASPVLLARDEIYANKGAARQATFTVLPLA